MRHGFCVFARRRHYLLRSGSRAPPKKSLLGAMAVAAPPPLRGPSERISVRFPISVWNRVISRAVDARGGDDPPAVPAGGDDDGGGGARASNASRHLLFRSLFGNVPFVCACAAANGPRCPLGNFRAPPRGVRVCTVRIPPPAGWSLDRTMAAMRSALGAHPDADVSRVEIDAEKGARFNGFLVLRAGVSVPARWGTLGAVVIEAKARFARVVADADLPGLVRVVPFACPAGVLAARAGSDQCLACDAFPHVTLLGTVTATASRCYRCLGKGHTQSACVNPPLCSNCLSPDHAYGRGGHCIGDFDCRHCRSSRHVTAHCPSRASLAVRYRISRTAAVALPQLRSARDVIKSVARNAVSSPPPVAGDSGRGGGALPSGSIASPSVSYAEAAVRGGGAARPPNPPSPLTWPVLNAPMASAPAASNGRDAPLGSAEWLWSYQIGAIAQFGCSLTEAAQVAAVFLNSLDPTRFSTLASSSRAPNAAPLPPLAAAAPSAAVSPPLSKRARKAAARASAAGAPAANGAVPVPPAVPGTGGAGSVAVARVAGGVRGAGAVAGGAAPVAVPVAAQVAETKAAAKGAVDDSKRQREVKEVKEEKKAPKKAPKKEAAKVAEKAAEKDAKKAPKSEAKKAPRDDAADADRAFVGGTFRAASATNARRKARSARAERKREATLAALQLRESESLDALDDDASCVDETSDHDLTRAERDERKAERARARALARRSAAPAARVGAAAAPRRADATSDAEGDAVEVDAGEDGAAAAPTAAATSSASVPPRIPTLPAVSTFAELSATKRAQLLDFVGHTTEAKRLRASASGTSSPPPGARRALAFGGASAAAGASGAGDDSPREAKDDAKVPNTPERMRASIESASLRTIVDRTTGKITASVSSKGSGARAAAAPYARPTGGRRSLASADRPILPVPPALASPSPPAAASAAAGGARGVSRERPE